jgi:hypothetical protein
VFLFAVSHPRLQAYYRAPRSALAVVSLSGSSLVSDSWLLELHVIRKLPADSLLLPPNNFEIFGTILKAMHKFVFCVSFRFSFCCLPDVCKHEWTNIQAKRSPQALVCLNSGVDDYESCFRWLAIEAWVSKAFPTHSLLLPPNNFEMLERTLFEIVQLLENMLLQVFVDGLIYVWCFDRKSASAKDGRLQAYD